MLGRRGFNVSLEAGAAAAGDEPPAHIRELMRIYEEAESHYDLFLLAESLIEYDETFSLWRLTHIKMVERMIGSKTGTGGGEGAAYLKKTVERHFFPGFWELPLRGFFQIRGAFPPPPPPFSPPPYIRRA